MIALDTNVLARFYIDDTTDPEAKRQRRIARRVLSADKAFFVPITVVLELEWVTRALYDFSPADFVGVVEHLIGLPHVTVEDWTSVSTALEWYQGGLDFADAIHLARSSTCEGLLTFDDRRFARRAARLRTAPPVSVPT